MAKNKQTVVEPTVEPDTGDNGRPSKRTTCPISREQFRKGAKPLSVTIAGVLSAASVKEFSTGSLGWYLNGKTTVEIDGVPVTVQVGLNLTIVGSKELPQG